MTIKDQVGNVTVEVGNPSPNHVRLYTDEAGHIEIGYAHWLELKNKIDRMFTIADDLAKGANEHTWVEATS